MTNNIINYTPQTSQIDVISPETMQHAVSILSQLNTTLDTITADKETLTKPLNASLKAIRDKYRPVETELNNHITTLKAKITTYQTQEIAKQKQIEAKILNDQRTTTETKINKLATIDQPEQKVTTDNGKVSFITVKKYRVTDINRVPRAFLIPNDTAIKEAMKESHPIDGVEYYEEQSLRNYR